MPGSLPLKMEQIAADLYLAKAAIKRAKDLPSKSAKYMKGQAGYHMQQAIEKSIKIQIYASEKKIDNAKIYNHKIYELIEYAHSLNIELILSKYIDDNAVTISGWEAEGRYDIHIVVRIDQLEKCLKEAENLYSLLKKKGFK